MLSLRHWLFVGMMSLLLGIVWLLVWFELILQMQLPLALKNFALIFFISTFILQVTHLIFMQARNPSPAFVFISFFFMGLFIHLFCGVLTKDVLVFIPTLARHEQVMSYLVALLAVLFNAWGIHMALRGPKIKHVFIPLPPEHSRLNSFKIVQISDLHVGPLIGKNYVRKVVEIANRLTPDLTVLTGDVGDSNPDIFGKQLAPLSHLRAKEGVFYVTGNHEYYWGAEKWIQFIRDCGIRPLINEGASLSNGSIWLGGIPDLDGPHFIPSHIPNANKALDPSKANDAYKILLAHQPKNCFAGEAAGFDLMLSGHTHGGQFFPFNLLVGFFNPYSKSLNQHQKMLVYVNRGTGFWGPALRLGVPAEITLLEFKLETT